MTPSESLALRTRLITDTDAEIGAILEEALRRIQAILAAQPSDAQRWVLSQLEGEIRRVLAEAAQDASFTVGGLQDSVAAAGRGLVEGALSRAGWQIVLPLISNTQVAAMREFLTHKIRDITLDVANRINTELGLALIGAQTPFEAVGKVAKLLQETTRERARSIVHTELARAYSASAQARLAQAAEDIPGLKKKWVKSGKAQPRLWHAVIHGQTQPWDKPFLLKGGTVKMMFPHDPSAPPGETINCGCTMVPVVPKA